MRRRRASPTRVTAPPRPQPRVAAASGRPGTSTTRATRGEYKADGDERSDAFTRGARPTDGVARPGPETWRGSVHRRAGEFRPSRGGFRFRVLGVDIRRRGGGWLLGLAPEGV